MNAVAPAVRTLTDLDVAAIADGVYRQLGSPTWMDRPGARAPTPYQVQQRARQTNVTPDNAGQQVMPAPMLQALLAHWNREHRRTVSKRGVQ